MNWKVGIAALLVLVGTFTAGYWSRPVQVRTVTETKTTQAEAQIVYRDRKVTETVVKYKDGTTVTTKQTEAIAARETEKVSVREKKQDTATVATALPRYSVGVLYSPYALATGHYVPSQADLGLRVLGGLWATVGYSFDSRAALVGVRVEF